MRPGMLRWVGVAGAVVSAVAVSGSAADRDAVYHSHLRVVVEDGLLKRGDLSRIARHATLARRMRPRNATADYACGLAYAKRLQYDRAFVCLQRSLRIDPTYLPAWRALFRFRLERNDKALPIEVRRLAAQAADEKANWTQADRRSAAVLLGKVCEFVSQQNAATPAKRTLIGSLPRIKQELGPKLGISFQSGRMQMRNTLESRKATNNKAALKRTIVKREKANATLDELKERSQENQDKSVNLKKTAEQWKAWLNGKLKEFDTRITSLGKDYKLLQAADARVAGLLLRTSGDIARLSRTRSQRRRVPGRDPATNFGLMRLEQESMRYQAQRLQLKRRAVDVLVSVRRAIASRSAAVANYQQATGRIVQEDKRLRRWNQILRNQANKARKRATETGPPARSRTTTAAVFPIDFASEAKRLLGTR